MRWGDGSFTGLELLGTFTFRTSSTRYEVVVTTVEILGGPLVNVQMVEADVRKSAQKIETAAKNVKGIDFSDSISAITSALPGSTCVGAANKLNTELKTNLDAWVRSANSHHELTNNAADHIVAADVTSQQTGNKISEQVGER